MSRRGLRPGDRIGALLPNGSDFALFYLACLYGGYTAVPLNAALPPCLLRQILAISRPGLIICDTKLVASLGETTASVWRVELPGDLLDLPASACVPSSTGSGLLSITFTSGTTSVPKGVGHRAGTMIDNVAAFNAHVGLSSDTRMLHAMPMAYMAGFLNTLLSPLEAGGTVVLGPQFEAGTALRFWQTAIAHDVNSVWLTPTMVALLTRLNRGTEVSSWTRRHMRHVFVGTAPLPEAVRCAFEDTFGVPALESYGMTEVLLVASNVRGRERGQSAGTLIKGIAMKALDANGAVVADGRTGELWIQTPYALAGYIDPSTSEPVSPLVDGWFPTGDIGKVDASAQLHITGRSKDLIIHGGTNVSPRAVEDALVTSPDVVDAAVVGIPHPFWGEEVVAFVQVEGERDAALMVESLVAVCREQLPPAAVPTRFVTRVEFPRTSTGKIQKHLLRSELLEAEHASHSPVARS